MPPTATAMVVVPQRSWSRILKRGSTGAAARRRAIPGSARSIQRAGLAAPTSAAPERRASGVPAALWRVAREGPCVQTVFNPRLREFPPPDAHQSAAATEAPRAHGPPAPDAVTRRGVVHRGR